VRTLLCSFSVVGAALAAAGIVVAAPATRAADGARVVINEVLYDAVGDDTGQEWVELFNAGAAAVDVSGWRIERGGASFETAAVVPAGVSLHPGDFLLVGEAAVPAADVVATLVLQNGGGATDGVRLVTAAGIPADVLLYDTPNINGLPDEAGTAGVSFAPDVAAGHSLGRVPDGTDTNASGADMRDQGAPTPRRSNGAPALILGRPLPPTASPTVVPAGVAVSEVLPDPLGDDAAGEFIELFNPTGNPVDLAGLQLDDGEGGSATFVRRHAGAHRGVITAVSPSQDGRLLATGGWDGRVRLWRLGR
jgi:hypothetical protein